MHFLMMALGLGCAWFLRSNCTPPTGPWRDRWAYTLSCFLFAPLLLLMTAIAIVCMGPSGQMVMHWEGWLSYGLAIAFLVWAGIRGLHLAWTGHQTTRHLHRHSVIQLQEQPVRLLDTPELYSAQIGFWRSRLVISQGLLSTLQPSHIQAVLAHEYAHAHYHDTFWFFWLGCLRRITPWLPHTEELWQELLTLRELRADRHAAQTVDPLVLAEALLLVVSAPLGQLQHLQPELCAAFSWAVSRDRLTERIDSLLAAPEQPPTTTWWPLSWLAIVCLPLVAIPFHGG